MTQNLAASPHTFILDVAWQTLPAALPAAAAAPLRLLTVASRPDPDVAWSAFGLRAMREAESARDEYAMATALIEALARSPHERVATFARAVRATVAAGGFTYGCGARFIARALRRIEGGLPEARVEHTLARLGQGLTNDCHTLREQQQAGRALIAEIEHLTHSPVIHALLQWYHWICETEPAYIRAVEAQDRLFDAIVSWDAATEWAEAHAALPVGA